MPKFNQNELRSIETAYHTGRELADAGLLEDAIPYFDQVLRRLPRRRRDRIYRIEGTGKRRLPEGVLWLPTIFRDALLAKAFCLNELGRPDDAFALLERAVELDPENPQVYAELGFTLSSQDNLEMAQSAYIFAAELEPDNPAHHRALARIALMAERFDEARGMATRALELDSTSVHALHYLAFAEYRLGNINHAITALERAYQLAPTDPESVRRLATTLREAGRVREAIACVNEFLQQDLSDPEMLGLMFDLLQQDGTAPELLPYARRLLTRNPQDPNALDLLAWGYYQQSNLTEAREILCRLVQIDPTQPYHHFKLGVVYQALGQLPPAMASFQRAVSLEQGGDVEAMALEAITVLDQVQIEQLVARARTDARFRHHLQSQTELALHQAGILLSPLGQMMLQTMDFSDDADTANDNGPRVIH